MARKNKKIKDIAKLMADDRVITRALRRGVRAALRNHKLMGNPICVWQDGKIVWIPPEEIPVDE